MPFCYAISAKKLGFNGNREILVNQHGRGRLGMQHYPAVPECPGRTARGLISGKPVFYPELIMRKWFLIKYMPELIIEFLIFIIVHFQDSIFNPERILIINIER